MRCAPVSVICYFLRDSECNFALFHTLNEINNQCIYTAPTSLSQAVCAGQGSAAPAASDSP